MKPKHFLFVDFETYYDQEYSLRTLSPPEYILDPRYETLILAAYDTRWPAPRIILPEDIPTFLASYPAEETFCCSHNALFDLSILSWRYNWVAGQLQDTLGMARALRTWKRYSLGSVCKELFGTDSKGDIVHKVKGMHAADIKRAGLWPDFLTYAMTDVRLCKQIYAHLAPEFPEEERAIMDLVLRCAVTPRVHADTRLLETHLVELRKRKERLLSESGYDKAALMSTVQFSKALEDLGVMIQFKPSPSDKTKTRYIPQFSKTDPFMQELLEYGRSPDDDINYQVQTLAAARLSQRSTIEETRAQRFVNIARLPWDNSNGTPLALLPVALRYGAAHTHRLGGEWSMNLQNLPRDKVKSRLRQALMAPPGFKLVCADLAQIEARIVATVCGQDDLVDAFRRGEDVYAKFASIIFARSITKADDPNERFVGKQAILGLGYNCGHDRFYTMVTTLARKDNIPLEGIFDRDIASDTVDTYRTTYDKIASSWRDLHNLMVYLRAVEPQGTRHGTKPWGPHGLVTFMPGKIKLPNNMYLRYDDLTHLYGAKILENIVQALARNVVMQAAVRLAAVGLRFVMQSHDELVFVVQDALVEDAKLIIKQEMIRPPSWLPEVPLAVEIGVGQNYGAAK